MDQQATFPQPANQGQMTVGDWLITLIITAIPLVGFIMLFVWAFGGGAQPSKKTWAQATLLFMLIMLVLWIVLISVIGFSIANFFSGYNA
ncbi:MAG: hypothetical protein Kow0098_21490 [Ignavibacteriaceae bacterium]